MIDVLVPNGDFPGRRLENLDELDAAWNHKLVSGLGAIAITDQQLN